MSDTEPTAAGQHIARDIAFRAGQAIDDGRPLFLIVYYEHEVIKLAFLKTLTQTLHETGISAQTFDPAQRPEHGAGRLYPLLSATAGTRTLALIAGIPRQQDSSGSAASFLDYLNVHRDRIARDKLRLVLFLHTSEAERFMANAGDLWDFRHHTYWLEGAPARDGASLWQSMEQGVTETALSGQDKEEIASHLQNVGSLVERTGEVEEKAALLLDLSHWLSSHHVPGQAVEAALEGLQLLPEAPSAPRGDLEHALGYALRMDHNLSDALVHYQRALAIHREVGDRFGEGTALNNIAMIYHAWGRYDEALKALEESLAICREIGDRSGEGVTLNNISQIYHVWGRYDEALKTLEESLAIRRETGDRSGEGTTLNNISLIYDAWGRYDEALKALEESLAICRETGDRAGEGTTLNNISSIYFALERYDEALKTLEESLAIWREIGDRSGEGTTLNNISQIYDAWGRYDEALKALEESLAIRREIGDRSGEGVNCWNLAWAYKRRGELPKAIEFARRSVEIKEELQHPDARKSREFLLSLEEELTAVDRR